jgi:hypothetical protein
MGSTTGEMDDIMKSVQNKYVDSVITEELARLNLHYESCVVP